MEIKLYKREGIWYWLTDDGEMCCPPFVHTKEEIANYFQGTSVTYDFMDIDKYEVANLPKRKKKKHLHRGPYRAVVQLTLEGEEVARYETAADAARALGIHRQSISGCLRGDCKTAAGYKWEFA